MPITGAAYVSDTPSFAISSAVWFHGTGDGYVCVCVMMCLVISGCHGINSGRGSLTVNLVSRCVLRDWQEVEGRATPSDEDSSVQLSQVYWIHGAYMYRC